MKKPLQAFLAWLKGWHSLVSTLVFFIGLFFGAKTYIDSRIKAVVSDREFLTLLANRIRPSMIVDEYERVEADLGGYEYIESITFTNNPALDTIRQISIAVIPGGYRADENQTHLVPNVITLTPKQHLAYPPILTPLPPFTCAYKTHRGKGHSWIYEITYVTQYGGANPPPLRLKFEIIK